MAQILECDIFYRHGWHVAPVSSVEAGATLVGVGTAVNMDEEIIRLSDVDHFLDLEIKMTSIVISGNRSSKIVDGWFLTPRGYKF
ncbi:MAG: hypothetical protein WC647_15950 [Desulfomonilaceae bacterium]